MAARIHAVMAFALEVEACSHRKTQISFRFDANSLSWTADWQWFLSCCSWQSFSRHSCAAVA